MHSSTANCDHFHTHEAESMMHHTLHRQVVNQSAVPHHLESMCGDRACMRLTYGLRAMFQGVGDLAMPAPYDAPVRWQGMHAEAGGAKKRGGHRSWEADRRVWETSPCCTTLDSPTSCI